MIAVLRSNEEPELRGDRAFAPSLPEAEMAILGAAMFDPEFMVLSEDRLKPHFFAHQGNRLVFEAISALAAQASPVTVISVADMLKRKSQLDAVGGQMVLLEMVDSCLNSKLALDYIELLEDKWMRREAMRLGDRLIRSANDSRAIAESLSESVGALSDLGTSRTGTAEPLYVAGQSALQRMFENAERGDGMLGPSTGLYDLDALIRGVRPKSLDIIAARPAMGKSSLGLQIADAVAAQGIPTLFISLEADKESSYFRLLAAKLEIDAGRIESGLVDMDDRFNQAIIEINDKPLFIFDSDCGYSSIEAMARDVKRKCGNKLGMVVIDYLQLLDCPGNNRVEALSKLTRQLKKMAMKLDCNVTALSQLNRGVEGRQCKRPTLSDLRESGSIEQDANCVMAIYRDEYYNPETPDKGVAEIIVLKQRSGPVGTAKTLFEPRFCRFRNLATRR